MLVEALPEKDVQATTFKNADHLEPEGDSSTNHVSSERIIVWSYCKSKRFQKLFCLKRIL